MKARLLLALCALLAFPGCFDPIVGSQCAKGYSRCGGKCVVAGTCTLADADVDAMGEEAGIGDDAFDSPDASGAETSEWDASYDSEILADAEGEDADADASPPDTSGMGDEDGASDGASDVEDAGIEQIDVSLEDTSSLPEADVALTGGEDAGSPEDAVDAPVPLPDASPDTWLDPDLAPSAADGPNDGDGDALPCPDCDGGVDAASIDASISLVDGVDANQEDAGIGSGDADGGDAEDDALGVEAGPLVCEGTLTACEGQCVDTNTNPNHCHECGHNCPSGECISGVCLECAEGETVCHATQTCANTSSDPDNCGFCGNVCASGLCSSGACEAAGSGRVIVIGHDYSSSNADKNQILANAVFLWRRLSSVRLLVYQVDSTTLAVTGTENAIVPGPNQTFEKRIGDADTVLSELAWADVFIIYAQAFASNETLINLGTKWANTLRGFVESGRTVILLDGDQATNNGTVQILSAANLFNLARQSSASALNVRCSIAASGDFLVAGTSNKTGYACRYFSTTFTLGETGPNITSVVEAVVGDAASAPVIARKTF